ncbi:Putative lumazine-binding [Mucilaginibacter mallensis]|uniref:Putative lumazine-binding n=1 Tax=Mucilaginibacter mallensis TaxID=652787 RepID=A0A1H2CCU5_MUCMA|nr:nuclear transport factor 2 family protein [Mucilaginibacter mallensis]SDT68281.1 Putative lumazine-binding [Mucilaginibacter mallensis]
MKNIKLLSIVFLIITQHAYAQQKTADRNEITDVINEYSKYVIEKDSIAFYSLFNDGPVTWCAALKERSQAREFEKNGIKAAKRNYFSGSYQAFMRSLSRYKSTEDKFDNIRIVEDGTVASVSMDYSFWADNKMANWGGKYLTLIKRDGKWKITSVIYSLELTDYFNQPPLKERQKRANIN